MMNFSEPILQTNFTNPTGLSDTELLIYRITLFSCLIGSILNCLVLYIGIQLYKNKEPSHLLICSMAAADLLMTLFAEPMRILQQDIQLQIPVLCVLIESSNWIGLPASAFSLTLLNIDKFIHFYWPLRYPGFMTKTKVWSAVLFCWLLCLLDVIAIYTFQLVERHEMCKPQRADPTWYVLYSILFAIVPATSSLLVSLYLFILTERMWRREKICYEQTTGMDFNQLKSSFHRLRVIRYLLGSALWTGTALLPVRIFYLLVWFTTIGEILPYWVPIFFHTLLTFNAIVNPLITLTMHPQYKDRMRSFLACLHRFNTNDTLLATSVKSLQRELNEHQPINQSKTNETLLHGANSVNSDYQNHYEKENELYFDKLPPLAESEDTGSLQTTARTINKELIDPML